MKRKGQDDVDDDDDDNNDNEEYNPESFVTVGTSQPLNIKDVSAKNRNSVLPIHLQEVRVVSNCDANRYGRLVCNGALQKPLIILVVALMIVFVSPSIT